MKDIRQIIPIIKNFYLGMDIGLLTDGIHIPQLTPEFDTFSIQGNLTVNSQSARQIKGITVQFLGTIDRLKTTLSNNQKSVVIENQMQLLQEPTKITPGNSTFAFELALPRSLPPSMKSELFKLKYTITAIVECDDHRFSHKVPVQVFNPHLAPHQEMRQNFYEHSGSAGNLIDYNIQFSKRFFAIDEMVNFRVNVLPQQNVTMNYITARLLQKVVIYSDSNRLTQAELPQMTILSKDSYMFYDQQPSHTMNFHLPISERRLKKFLLPTVDSTYFEIRHTIQILINYQVWNSSTSKVCLLQIPVGVSTESNTSILESLPNYEEFRNSTYIPNSELPPIYTNFNARPISRIF
ncbi:hypothetical protein CONCODRAFT_83029 [Conidiobolus coronatus NRRL 28638]|uniref:Arrestin C-terminal-like domain-containing protein n=1 Tax=Conidiobolus coronatus (strain ATCC 28846 / CBS 209.66 / NRRL 28638) TaxID=796925 RepID=A0A137PH69_CONC2|nr:hypothetical protein CONCODRAFT_83029 [Conidiobolus coronatus NRRL 28638]|eukprot:KXN74315.1 hypothetical protein CONCODRAFT_83029 [Conidiobolus coronatus NRRL 28638]